MSNEQESQRLLSMTWNVGEKITWALIAGMGVLVYWGITSKIEDVAGSVCGCGQYIRQNARMIRQLSRHHDEVSTDGNLPLDIDRSSGPIDHLDRSSDGVYRHTDIDTGVYRCGSVIGTGPKIYADRRIADRSER